VGVLPGSDRPATHGWSRRINWNKLGLSRRISTTSWVTRVTAVLTLIVLWGGHVHSALMQITGAA
jgi:hypothetical protein